MKNVQGCKYITCNKISAFIDGKALSCIAICNKVRNWQPVIYSVFNFINNSYVSLKSLTSCAYLLHYNELLSRNIHMYNDIEHHFNANMFYECVTDFNALFSNKNITWE